MEEQTNGLHRLIGKGIETIGVGAGTYIGSGGDPMATVTALSGTILGAVGNEIAARVLSPRQEVRVGAVFFYAGSVISAKEVLGETLRDDGFFDGEHSYGYEFAEGVMLVAMDSFEERKLPYLGNMLANVAFIPTIDAATANFALKTAEGLSWLELCLIGIIDQPEKYPLPDSPIQTAKAWETHTVRSRLTRMADVGSELLMYGRTKTERAGLPIVDTNLSSIRLTNTGKLIAGLMELSTIPDSELRPTYNLLLLEEEADSENTTSAQS